MRIRKQQLNQMGSSLRMEKASDLLQQKGLSVSQVDKKKLLIVKDAENRQTQITFNDDNSIALKTALGRQYKVQLNEQGLANTFTDPCGLTISETNAHNNRLTTIHRGSDTEYKLLHDSKGQLRQIRYPDNTDYKLETDGRSWQEIDRNGQKINYVFDDQKRLRTLTDSRNNTTQFDYDENNYAHRLRFADGKIYDYDVDEDGLPSAWRINGKEYANYNTDGEKPGLNINYADGHKIRYAVNGNKIVEAETDNFVLKLEYDDNDNLLSEDQNGQIVQYEYDKTNLLTAIITPDDDKIDFHRNQEGKIDKVIDWNQQKILISYQKNGQMKQIHYPNGVVTSIESNQSGLDQSIHTHSSKTNQTLIHQVLSRDKCDRVIGVSEQSQQRRYEYDNEGHLTAVKSSNSAQNESFKLDAMGNYESINATHCQYDKLNQITSYGQQNIQHDSLGNTVHSPTAKGYISFVYNGQGSLTRAQLSDVSQAVYEYDALGRRVKKTVNKIVTEYIWAGFTLLSERITKDDGDKVGDFKQRDHLFLPAAFLPLSMRVDGDVYQQHTDHRMACSSLTDSLGRVVWQAEYNALGQAKLVLSQVSNPWRLMNQYYDDETGLHYNLARYYNPLLGRYLSADPLLEKGGSLNFYLYGRADPINHADPTGLFIFTAMAVGFVIGAVIAGGIETYKQYNGPGTLGEKAWAITKKAAAGGLVGAVGGLVGALAVTGGAALAGVSVVAVEAGTASLGVIAALGAVEGVAGGLAELCLESKLEGRSPTAMEFVIAVGVGGGIGAISGGVGGVIAQRAVRKAAAEAAEKAAKEAAEKLAREAAEKLTREASEKAAKESSEKAAKEAAEKAAKEAAAEKARKEAAEKTAANFARKQAIKNSNMALDHGERFSKVASDRGEYILTRNVNPDATDMIAHGASTKSMAIKGKSSDWGPQHGAIPVDQKFSKMATGPADEIDEMQKKVNKLLSPKDGDAVHAIAVPLKVDGQKVMIVKNTIPPPGHDVIKKGDEFFQLSPPGNKILTEVKPDGPGTPMMVLGDPKTKAPMTADYDLLAVGHKKEGAASGDFVKSEYDEVKGISTPAEERTIEALQDSTEIPTDAIPKPQRVVHHGPEVNNPNPEKFTPPITAFDPDGGVRSINTEGELAEVFNEANSKGYNMDPNPGWGWTKNDSGQWVVQGK